MILLLAWPFALVAAAWLILEFRDGCVDLLAAMITNTVPKGVVMRARR